MDHGEYAQPGFHFAGLLHASAVTHIEHQVGVHPESQLSCRLFVESYKAVSYLDFGCEVWPEVLLVPSPACEKYCLRLCRVKMEVSSVGPLNTLCGTGFEFFDHLIHVLPRGTHLMPSQKDRPSIRSTLSSTLFISLAVSIAKRIGDTGDLWGIPTSTG